MNVLSRVVTTIRNNFTYEVDYMKKCQVFTPEYVVNIMLDIAGYKHDLFGKKVLESACGSGNILSQIVRRYIIHCLNKGIDYNDVKKGLENDIVGYDVEEECCQQCRERLDAIAEMYGIKGVQWQIINANTLRLIENRKFDFALGNPPYITYRDLSANERKELKERFSSCQKGAFDYCYAFIEHDLNCLAESGKMVYLIPSSIFKNVHAQKLREIILSDVINITDFTTKKLFGKILTSSALLVCKKGANEDSIIYENVGITPPKRMSIAKYLLTSNKWVFCSEEKVSKKDMLLFSDFFSASIVVATLLNDAFVLKGGSLETDAYVTPNGFRIEKEIVRPSASPRALRSNKTEHIIFPYQYSDCLIYYSEDDFFEKFPEATRYLSKYKNKLMKRDADKKCKWFEYGRTQALNKINAEKLLISTVVTSRVEVYRLNKETIPYAGIFIRQKAYLPLSFAETLLKSEAFYNYVHSIGIYANGSSVRITPADIENFSFSLGDYSDIV